MGNPISKEVMRHMIPNIVGAHSMTVAVKVDYLIGLGLASLHPQRIQKENGGGDFWLWENAFGSCVGSSHPLVNSCPARHSIHSSLDAKLSPSLAEISLKSLLNHPPGDSSFIVRIMF